MRTGTGLNERLHWARRARNVKSQRKDVAMMWPWRHRAWAFPVVVKLTRISPWRGKAPDDDQTVGGLKAVRDQVASELGVDDGDETKVTWEYTSERGPWGVRIEIREGT